MHSHAFSESVGSLGRANDRTVPNVFRIAHLYAPVSVLSQQGLILDLYENNTQKDRL